MSTILSRISGAPSHILLMLIFTYIKFQSMITIHYFDKSDLQSFKVPILQVVLLFRMQLRQVAHFFHPLLGGCNSKATAKQQQTHPKVMTKMVKKCSTGQSCNQKEVTSYKIHTLAVAAIFKSLSFPSTATP